MNNRKFINKILQGDCLKLLKEMEDNSVDSIVTDPPYGLGFMGKEWDTFDKKQFGQSGEEGKNDLKVKKNFNILPRYGNPKDLQEFTYQWAKECLRVLKPGGYLLSFGGTRTYHRMACAIEDAGFEIRDMIEWIYGSGFPKSYNIGKGINKFIKTGNASWNGTGDSSNGALGYSKLQYKQDYRTADYSNKHQNKEGITEELAKHWECWGTALKPSHEPICMARKPLSEKTVAENCLKWRTGGINIDECRVGTKKHTIKGGGGGKGTGWGKKEEINEERIGRFPANLIHDNSEEVRECFPETKSGSIKAGRPNGTSFSIGGELGKRISTYDTQGDSGNASRFFKSIKYCAKASKSERNAGCENIKPKLAGAYEFRNRESGKGQFEGKTNTLKSNNHPTVKPLKLMQYLIKMVTPKGGIVLDPFAGSGTTGVACVKEGMKFIGIEMADEYITIAQARIDYWKNMETQESLAI